MSRHKIFEAIAKEQNWHKMFGGDTHRALGIGPFQLLYKNRSSKVEGLSMTTLQSREMIFDLISWRNHTFPGTTAYYYLNTRIQWPIFILEPMSHPDYLLYTFFNRFKKTGNSQYEDFQLRYRLVSPLNKMRPQFLSHEIKLFFNYEHNWTIEGNGQQLLLYKENNLIASDQLRSFIQVCQTIVKMFSGEQVL